MRRLCWPQSPKIEIFKIKTSLNVLKRLTDYLLVLKSARLEERINFAIQSLINWLSIHHCWWVLKITKFHVGESRSRIREIFACWVQNPGLLNPEYSSRNLESNYRLESGIPFHWRRIRNLVSEIQNLRREIQNPRMYWIPLPMGWFL